MDAAADCAIDRGEILGLDGALFSMAAARAAQLERAAAEWPGARARRTGDPHLESQEVAGAKKIAARQGRVIVFIDESGLSERPCRARTWAPKGETPVLQYRFSWKQLSVTAGISYWRFYFRLFNGSIKSPQIVEFLKALQVSRLREASASYFPAVVLTRRSPERHPSTLVTCRGRPAAR